MLTGLDHVVVVVPDLAAAMERYAALGFSVDQGGRHSTGTHNALIGFSAGYYLELVAFLEPAPQHRWAAALAHGGGLVGVCLSSDDLDADVGRFRANGLAMEAPRAMSRVKPDGTELRWRLSVPQGKLARLAPFLIQDLTPIEARRPRHRAHANGVSGISSIRVASDEAAALRGLFTGLLPESPHEIIHRSLAAVGRRYGLAGPAFDVLQPATPTSALAAWLARRGPSLHSLELIRTGRKTEQWPAAATLGVPMDLIGGD